MDTAAAGLIFSKPDQLLGAKEKPFASSLTSVEF
jgi:hypothetical protein